MVKPLDAATAGTKRSAVDETCEMLQFSAVSGLCDIFFRAYAIRTGQGNGKGRGVAVSGSELISGGLDKFYAADVFQ